MKCSKCGAELSADMRFCAYCGRKIEEPMTPPPVMEKAEFCYVVFCSFSVWKNDCGHYCNFADCSNYCWNSYEKASYKDSKELAAHYSPYAHCHSYSTLCEPFQS